MEVWLKKKNPWLYMYHIYLLNVLTFLFIWVKRTNRPSYELTWKRFTQKYSEPIIFLWNCISGSRYTDENVKCQSRGQRQQRILIKDYRRWLPLFRWAQTILSLIFLVLSYKFFPAVDLTTSSFLVCQHSRTCWLACRACPVG